MDETDREHFNEMIIRLASRITKLEHRIVIMEEWINSRHVPDNE